MKFKTDTKNNNHINLLSMSIHGVRALSVGLYLNFQEYLSSKVNLTRFFSDADAGTQMHRMASLTCFKLVILFYSSFETCLKHVLFHKFFVPKEY